MLEKGDVDKRNRAWSANDLHVASGGMHVDATWPAFICMARHVANIHLNFMHIYNTTCSRTLEYYYILDMSYYIRFVYLLDEVIGSILGSISCCHDTIPLPGRRAERVGIGGCLGRGLFGYC
jgi:hypothetical protein